MNQIEKLYADQKYELLIKLVGDSHDPKERFLVLSSLVILGRRDDALKEIDKYQAILETSHPFQLMKMHFELLLAEKHYDNARIALKHYENLPYISQEAEEFLREIGPRIEDESHAKNNANLLPLDVILETLETATEQGQIAQSLFSLKNYNINVYIDSLKIFLLRKDVHPNFRTYALILLIDQKYDGDVEILEHGQKAVVNPTEITPPFMHEDFNEVCHQITMLAGGDTSLTETSLHLFNCYILDTYPDDIYVDGVLPIARAIVEIGKRYLNQGSEPNNELANKIQKIIEDTPIIKF